MKNNPKIIISGGGTGGHIFPALSIAGSLKDLCPECEILFVGARGRMEMEKIPAAGYQIIGLPVAGLQRKLTLSNLTLPFKLVQSLAKARRILKEFKPDVVVGVGGYASAPVLWSAARLGIPCLIQEQNSFAGLTNKILSKKAARICTAYEGMDKFFPKDKIILTGNPIRKEIAPASAAEREEGYSYYKLDPARKTLFIVGGSLGARTLNNAMKQWVENRAESAQYQVIWQCGKLYKSEMDEFMAGRNVPNLYYSDFIYRMDLAYAVADVLVSRAGAGTISELCVAGKATIFVPSPMVAEDHQTHNAMALVEKDAAMMVSDDRAEKELINLAEELLDDDSHKKTMENNILKLGKKDASEVIAKEVLALIR